MKHAARDFALFLAVAVCVAVCACVVTLLGPAPVFA